MYKEFINNPKIKAEIEVSEKLSDLSPEKLEVVLEMIKLLGNLKD